MKILKWSVFNSIFAVFIYFGFVQNVEGMKNIAYFIAWLDITSSMILLSKEGMSAVRKIIYKQKHRAIPTQLRLFVSFLFIFTFVWFGAWITGFFLILSFIITESAKQVIYNENKLREI